MVPDLGLDPNVAYRLEANVVVFQELVDRTVGGTPSTSENAFLSSNDVLWVPES
jgi:hypothetical protein